MYIIFTEHRRTSTYVKSNPVAKQAFFNDLIRQLYLGELKKVPKTTSLKRRAPTFYILCKTRQDLIYVSKFLYTLRLFNTETETQVQSLMIVLKKEAELKNRRMLLMKKTHSLIKC